MAFEFDYLSMNRAPGSRPGRRFERYVGHLLWVLGCRQVTYLGGESISEDGTDYVAVRDTELFPRVFTPVEWGVQCKCVRSPNLSKIQQQLTSMVHLRGLRHILLVLALDPSSRLRQGLQHWASDNHVRVEIWGKSELDRFAQHSDSLREWLTDAPSDPEAIESRYFRFFYHLGPNYATAIRLVGAGGEFFTPLSVRMHVDPRPYRMPPEFQLERDAVLRQLEEDARRNGQMFYDGPHTRLVAFRATPIDPGERKHLELTVGPLGWYDYSVLNELLGRQWPARRVSELTRYVDLDQIAHHGNIRNVKLSNLLDTATTIVTSDGMITYSQRSYRVSASPGQLTCSVAENIHQEKDGSLQPQREGDMPAPFKTVLRGIAEELSPKLLSHVTPRELFLLGMSFDLQAFHPDLLFIVPLPIPFDELLEICREDPGPDFVEGQLKAVPAVRSSQELTLLMAQPNWFPGGKASLIRAIEFLDSLRSSTAQGMQDVIAQLVTGDAPSVAH